MSNGLQVIFSTPPKGKTPLSLSLWDTLKHNLLYLLKLALCGWNIVIWVVSGSKFYMF